MAPVPPAAPVPAPAALPPPVAFEETPASAFGAPLTPAPAAVAEHPPHGTLITTQTEAAELRRRIANPGIPEPDAEIEMDLEELDEVSEPTHGKLVPEAHPAAAAPPPEPPPAVGRAAEVEVPIDIEVAPGTTRVSLNLRLVLNLKPRR
jgi:hypothetical protein